MKCFSYIGDGYVVCLCIVIVTAHCYTIFLCVLYTKPLVMETHFFSRFQQINGINEVFPIFSIIPMCTKRNICFKCKQVKMYFSHSRSSCALVNITNFNANGMRKCWWQMNGKKMEQKIFFFCQHKLQLINNTRKPHKSY